VIAIAGIMLWRAGSRRRSNALGGGSIGQEIGAAPASLTFAGGGAASGSGSATAASASAKSKKKRAELERARQRHPQTFSALEALAQANATAMEEGGAPSESTTRSSYVPPALAVMAPLEPGSDRDQSRC
jgi:hypothetical protein